MNNVLDFERRDRVHCGMSVGHQNPTPILCQLQEFGNCEFPRPAYDLRSWVIELKKRIHVRRFSRHFAANYAEFNRIRTNRLKNGKSGGVLLK